MSTAAFILLWHLLFISSTPHDENRDGHNDCHHNKNSEGHACIKYS